MARYFEFNKDEIVFGEYTINNRTAQWKPLNEY